MPKTRKCQPRHVFVIRKAVQSTRNAVTTFLTGGIRIVNAFWGLWLAKWQPVPLTSKAPTRRRTSASVYSVFQRD
jgi:hypothetical protein